MVRGESRIANPTYIGWSITAIPNEPQNKESRLHQAALEQVRSSEPFTS